MRHSPTPDDDKGRADQAVNLITGFAGLYAVLGGIITLLGWALHAPRLTDWAGKGISMFPNAAVCGIACGAGLLIALRGLKLDICRVLTCVLGGISIVIGGLTVFEHVTYWNFHIDEFLFKGTWGQEASASPMRIGVPASTSFFFLGIGLIFSVLQSTRKLVIITALIPLAICSLSLTGYFFGADQLFGMARFTGISWQTATIVAVLAIGLQTAVPEHGLVLLISRQDAGGSVARKLILPMIVIPFMLGWFRLVGQQSGIFDAAFGTAVRTLIEVLLFLGFLWWTANSISKHAVAAENAESALRASEELFSYFMSSLPGLAWIKDSGGRYLFVNDGAVKAFGKARDQLCGLTDREIFPPGTAAQFRENDRRAMSSESGVQVIESLTQDDGIHFALVSKFPILDQEGNPMFVGGMAIDITDRMRAEEALRDANRRKDEFLATLAHELRNPLAPIRMAGQFIKTKSPPDSEMQWALDVIERQVQQMVRLLEDLLDVSRITFQKLELREEKVELAEVIRRAMETSRPLLEEGGHACELKLPDSPVFLRADSLRLAQVFSNLLNNAAKFTRKNGHICVSGRLQDGQIRISVKDDGIGIPAHMLVTIFDKFSQGERSGRSHGGLGIGLALVKGLVELHGGNVEARSEGPDCGSEFIVSLPVPDCGEDATPETGIVPAARVGRTYRLLVVDDLRDSAESIAGFLKTKGHEVFTAYDGEEALREADGRRPDIILLDIGMPKVDGHEVCRRIRAESWGKDICFVAITGWGQEADRLRTKEAGFDVHLVKPVAPEALSALLDSFDRSSGNGSPPQHPGRSG